MNAHKFRWLAPLSLIGFLGLILKQPLFFGMFGFAAFVVLFWYDERTESVFERSATIAFMSGMIAFAGSFVYFGVLSGPGSTHQNNGWDVMMTLTNLWGLTYSLMSVVFGLSYIYLYRRGD